MVHAICFDLYKTLLDIDTDECGECTFQVFTQWLNEDYTVHLNWQDVRHVFQALLKNETDRTGSSGREVNMRAVIAGILSEFSLPLNTLDHVCYRYRVASRNRIGLYKDVKPVLDQLRSTALQLVLLTNAQKEFTDPELSMFKLQHYFDTVLFSSEEGYRKPASELYVILEKKTGLSCADMMMIGDDYTTDIAGANNAGMTAVLIAREPRIRPAGPETGIPDYTIATLDEILPLLQRQ